MSSIEWCIIIGLFLTYWIKIRNLRKDINYNNQIKHIPLLSSNKQLKEKPKNKVILTDIKS